jgi:hypothetical protein
MSILIFSEVEKVVMVPKGGAAVIQLRIDIGERFGVDVANVGNVCVCIVSLSGYVSTVTKACEYGIVIPVIFLFL